MDAHEAYNERTIRGVGGISSQESKGVCNLSLHTPKEFAWRGRQTPACYLKRYTCPTCPRPTQSVNPMNSEVMS
ncbi:hypothetical protein J1N35_016264 [Gossypium stocksii]|uniref:Uncharacterized protein n=1 Tax=Gossypium stocksii TaxID=47602 RepID=A0A9D3VKV5_9ROSI|nr:hypothetical protein J1N35_016264 [Gossypium stocksii]